MGSCISTTSIRTKKGKGAELHQEDDIIDSKDDTLLRSNDHNVICTTNQSQGLFRVYYIPESSIISLIPHQGVLMSIREQNTLRWPVVPKDYPIPTAQAPSYFIKLQSASESLFDYLLASDHQKCNQPHETMLALVPVVLTLPEDNNKTPDQKEVIYPVETPRSFGKRSHKHLLETLAEAGFGNVQTRSEQNEANLTVKGIPYKPLNTGEVVGSPRPSSPHTRTLARLRVHAQRHEQQLVPAPPFSNPLGGQGGNLSVWRDGSSVISRSSAYQAYAITSQGGSEGVRTKMVCGLCWKMMHVEQHASVLPCGHVFHTQCISPSPMSHSIPNNTEQEQVVMEPNQASSTIVISPSSRSLPSMPALAAPSSSSSSSEPVSLPLLRLPSQSVAVGSDQLTSPTSTTHSAFPNSTTNPNDGHLDPVIEGTDVSSMMRQPTTNGGDAETIVETSCTEIPPCPLCWKPKRIQLQHNPNIAHIHTYS
eukprot:NODE_1425_length_1964_cov_50.329169_g1206_i0.p1 GENE.NODE_1425_length_1964_cov_50.329169_g1206_i0~~NODE_1425_length_1964_cov_50.329169_g1206_i0.p1  ORF type:complete len:479 (+),score=85.30 NODE_1425_length_1964_cov_50.329169_g1206_i0:64-1500(+)